MLSTKEIEELYSILGTFNLPLESLVVTFRSKVNPLQRFSWGHGLAALLRDRSLLQEVLIRKK